MPEAAKSTQSPFPSREERSRGRAAKREAVLRAAVRMFNARGYNSASLDDVAASLRISKPTIYYYLGNKEDVLLECLGRGIEQLREAAAAAAAAPGPGLDRLRFFLHRYAEIAMDDFGRCVIRTSETVLSDGGADRFRGLKSEIDGVFRRLIADGVADGSLGDVDVRLTAFMLAGALNGTARWHKPDGAMTPAEIAARMTDLLTGGITPRG